MLYASDVRHHSMRSWYSTEENPDDVPELVAEILVHVVEERLRRNLTTGYRQEHEALNRVRGRIDHLNTARHHLLERGQISCHFDELTVNTPRNCYVRAALLRIASVVTKESLAHRCKQLGHRLYRFGVTGNRPSHEFVLRERYGRHDAADRQMVQIARLAFDLALPTEDDGESFHLTADHDEHWLRNLFERGVRGFYQVVLPDKGWSVSPGNKILNWPVESSSGRMDEILPIMKADIVLEHPGCMRRIVIDTKFTSVTTEGWYRKESLKSGYLYQIYSYLRTQESHSDPYSAGASGLMLHPSVGDYLDEYVTIQGHDLRFATVDLSGSTSNVRKRLLEMLS